MQTIVTSPWARARTMSTPLTAAWTVKPFFAGSPTKIKMEYVDAHALTQTQLLDGFLELQEQVADMELSHLKEVERLETEISDMELSHLEELAHVETEMLVFGVFLILFYLIFCFDLFILFLF